MCICGYNLIIINRKLKRTARWVISRRCRLETRGDVESRTKFIPPSNLALPFSFSYFPSFSHTNTKMYAYRRLLINVC